MTDKNQKPDYGNWVPLRLLKIGGGIAILMLIISYFSKAFMNSTFISLLSLVLGIILAAFTIYMSYVRSAFSLDHGGYMEVVYSYLVRFVDSELEGKGLDIGCGAAAITTRVAKRCPGLSMTGVDYWGDTWDYDNAQCVRNAKIEGLDIHFEWQDAASLIFEDESFDLIISNFVFHEVKTAEDKRDVVREALRVLKKGGTFVLHDLFCQEKIYGDFDKFVEELKAEGIEEITFIKNTENEMGIPGSLRAPWLLTGLGLIYGKK